VASGDTPVLRVGTKLDRVDGAWMTGDADVMISTRTGEGMDRLLDAIAGHLPDLSGRTSLSLPSRRRHVDCLRQAQRALDESLAGHHQGLDIRAEQLRLAGDAMGRITGRVDVENLLDVIFSEFCIGK
jgi:tRNA modification GTPase